MSLRDQFLFVFVEVWCLIFEVYNNVGQLFLLFLLFNKIEEFFLDVGDFMYKVVVRDLSKVFLIDKEYKMLNLFYDQLGEI